MNAFLDRLREHPFLGKRIVLQRHVAGQAAEMVPLTGVDRVLREALAETGVCELYGHQAQALQALEKTRCLLMATPTASGKTLIFSLPVFAEVLRDPSAKALFLYPTKALTQDQRQGFADLAAELGPLGSPRIEIYDGDTSAEARRRIRADPPQILLTNPDMLHLGMLAHADSWAPLWKHLRTVVVDEMHVYRGVFGAHVRHVLWRLRRTARRFGSDPRMIAASATVGNAREFGTELLGSEPVVIDRSGAPRTERDVVFINPVGVSPYTAAVRAIIEAVRAGKRTIAFTQSRKMTELIYNWLCREAPDLADRVAPYRAGYLPAERRRLERELFGGGLDAVITTSALELGIDVGDLDVCILVGWPGSVMSAWQRAGRAGRAGERATLVWIAMPDALEQWLIRHPEMFFDGIFEKAVLDPWNPYIAGPHLLCAAAEAPLGRDEIAAEGPQATAITESLAAEGKLLLDAGGDNWLTVRRRPHHETSLRAAGRPFEIVDGSGRVLGSVDGMRVYIECHPGAIYLHGGSSYRVRELDADQRRVVVSRETVDHYTQVMAEKRTEILEVGTREDLAGRLSGPFADSNGAWSVGRGRLRVTVTVHGYQTKRIFDGETIATERLESPPLSFETQGMWVELPAALAPLYAAEELNFMGSIHAVEHATIGLFPLLAISERGDVGGISYTGHPQLQGPAFFLYDSMPGGAGLAERAFADLPLLLERTRRLLLECPCEDGCPGCVQSPRCGNGNKPLDKQGAQRLVESILGVRSLVADGIEPAVFEERTIVAAVDPPPPVELPAGARHGIVRGGNLPAEDFLAPQPVTAQGRVLFFDLETRRAADEVGGWGRIDKMGLALAVVFDAQTQRYTTYYEKDVDRLLLDLVTADLVVGFNVDRFDLRVLSAYTDHDLSRIRTCDMLKEIHAALGYRLSLQHLAKVNLGEGKSADGLQSLAWWRAGEVERVENYCRQDVDVTRRIYELGQRQGYLLMRDKRERLLRIPVSW
jgi:DEAD/DEAH box helicase domain-containing protein